MAAATFLGIDLGAESGRGVLGRITDEVLELEEIHRFSNGPVRVGDSLHWDVLRLWSEINKAITIAAVDRKAKMSGIGIDTWGVDFALLGRGDVLLGNPHHYRDPRTNGILDKAFKLCPQEEIFERTGIQFMQFNSLFQLLAMRLEKSAILDAAETFLTMPDLFNFWLTGRKVCEFTNATTTQAYDPRKKQWAVDLLGALELPSRIMPKIVLPGTNLGELRKRVGEQTGAGRTPVIAPACHDTGSAVVAVPASRESSWAFISSGTWSLMGTEVNHPVINEASLRHNFTNEGGVGGTFRFLKNIMGLWLVQESRRTWQRAGKDYSYEQLAELAAKARPFVSLVDPDDPSFLPPGDMPARIATFCDRTGQPEPRSPGAVVRCCIESLALRYRQILAHIEECTERRFEVIHVVGGGMQNRLLCQATADATGRPVIAGPAEATAAGNIALQAVGTGLLKDRWAARELIRRSFDLVTYEPRAADEWQQAYDRFLRLNELED